MNEVRKPRALRRGDKVAVLSPSSPVDKQDLLNEGLARLRGWGLEPVVGEHALARLDWPRGAPLAGDDVGRIADLNRAIADPGVRAIFTTRGGYGTTRLLDQIDFARLREDPKPIIGFSDTTGLQLAAWREAGLVSLHGASVATPAAIDPGPAGWQLQYELLFEGRQPPVLPELDTAHVLRPGIAEGRLAGGNLSLVAALVGTPWQLDMRGALVFLEDIDEAPYRLDRMLTQLRHTGALSQAKGIVLGDFHEAGKPLTGDSPDLLRVFADRLGELEVPVAYGFPFGHRARGWTLPIGGRARLDAHDVAVAARLTLLEPAMT